MATAGEIATRYFEALGRQHLDAAVAARLDPASVWAGHADPVTGDVVGQLNDTAQAH